MCPNVDYNKVVIKPFKFTIRNFFRILNLTLSKALAKSIGILTDEEFFDFIIFIPIEPLRELDADLSVEDTITFCVPK